ASAWSARASQSVLLISYDLGAGGAALGSRDRRRSCGQPRRRRETFASRWPGACRERRRLSMMSPRVPRRSIAIVGAAVRFPGANDVRQFWSNLLAGVESIGGKVRNTAKEGRPPHGGSAATRLIETSATIPGIDLFDAEFFGTSPAEAAATDPQHRVMLECAWHALEDAGCDPATYDGSIGVFAGCSMNAYLAGHVRPDLAEANLLNDVQSLIANDKDYLATRISFNLDLKGPSVTVQTACSTSLVAVHLACQSLLLEECDLALAGGATIRIPQHTSYEWREGAYLSPDGRCRAFDAEAAGTVFGNGAGLVALKRLDEALADGDEIYAVIRGSAINNDGAAKVGFTAPSELGQAKAIVEAMANAGVDPLSVGYVEAHGTGTPLGDPIEIAALARAFGDGVARQSCAIGSVNTNVGHLERAARIAGMIKAALAIRHGVIPASLNFARPNPAIRFETTPFLVNGERRDWRGCDGRRVAGVSSFGIGGTNAHVVIEEAPERSWAAVGGGEGRGWLLPLSARSEAALRALAERYREFLGTADEAGLALRDITHAAGARRAHHDYRLAIVGGTCAQFIEGLGSALRQARCGTRREEGKLAFVYSGQGAQWWGMGRQLLARERAFREAIARCEGPIAAQAGFSLRDELARRQADSRLDGEDIAITQVALFALQVGLTALWRSWGIEPGAVVGHSMGEVAAAHAAAMLTLEEAVQVICTRARLLRQASQSGVMAALDLSFEEAREAI